MKSNLESFIDLIHERIWSLAILSQNLQINYYELYHCYICNMIWQMIQWNLTWNLLLIWFIRGSDPWQFWQQNLPMKYEIWSFWTKMRVGANPDLWTRSFLLKCWIEILIFTLMNLNFIRLFGKGSYILIAMSRR